MKETKYHISDITPLSSLGELEVTMDNTVHFGTEASRIFEREGLVSSELEDWHYAACFHPISQDLKLQILWKECTENAYHTRSISLPSGQQAALISAISSACREAFGQSPQELLETARKNDERKLLASFSL